MQKGFIVIVHEEKYCEDVLWFRIGSGWMCTKDSNGNIAYTGIPPGFLSLSSLLIILFLAPKILLMLKQISFGRLSMTVGDEFHRLSDRFCKSCDCR
jgi:hypothetical protein